MTKRSADLAAIEEQHGFTFGGGPKPAAPMVALLCTNPACALRGQHVPIHADTVPPVHCGGCYTVLHCQHQPDTRTVRAGTVGAPLEHTITACTACGTELERATRNLDPAEVLRNLPIGLLDQPL